MKIKLGTLRKLVREGIVSELVISPAFFRGNDKPLSDPMENGGLTRAIGEVERAFSTALMNTLVLSHTNKYNTETRDFDDAVYQQLKDAADTATEEVMSKLNTSLQTAWSSAVKQTGEKS